MRNLRNVVVMTTASAALLTAACGGYSSPMSPTPTPAPPGPAVTANAYILPGAVDLGSGAFGDHPLLIFKGERLRWVNIDSTEHNLVADAASLPEFVTTGTLAPGGERTFTMTTLGTTPFHCTIHPQMTGTLIVQER
jgi:plastocyanin